MPLSIKEVSAVSGDLFVQRNLKEAKTGTLLEDYFIEENPFYSEDGKAIYFVSNKNGNKDIFKFESDDQEEEEQSQSK